MKLSEHSINRFYSTFAIWEVPKDFADPIFNYYVYGFQPGSFFTALLANDFVEAIGKSHPANTIPSLKYLVGWLVDTQTRGTVWGSYDIVNNWLNAGEKYRRDTLEIKNLIYTSEQEIWMTLKGEKTNPVMLW